MRNKILLFVLVVFTILSPTRIISQNATYDPSVFIDIEINSGNPNSPFPQFLEYTGGKSLAKHNAEGVTHADMEKTLREAYEIMTHRCRYEGTYCNVKYISYNRDDVPGGGLCCVSEGDGYALLASAIFADQKTFNGLYMWIHDIRFSGVERFRDGGVRGTNSNDFCGAYMAGWHDREFDAAYGSDSYSETDGDVDIAMAMLIAYKQWGEWMMQDGQVVKDSRGNPISLKYEAQRVVGALVDTLGQWYNGNLFRGMSCGDVGIDGYVKPGNSWGELTRWRFTNDATSRYPNINDSNNGDRFGYMGKNDYIDYNAPSYFEEFWRWLKNGDGVDDNNRSRSEWEIHQFKRAAASSNWLNKKAYDLGLYASIGKVEMATDGEPTFDKSSLLDFRYVWRHILDYLWHGDADYDWDPSSHQVIEGQTNNSERLMGVRHAGLLKNPSDEGSQLCAKMGELPDSWQPSWFGVSQIPLHWEPTGGILDQFHSNFSVGAGATAAVASEDLELIADIYRQCELMWEGSNTSEELDPEERYSGSTPKYFHDWFRTLGMLVCSGNMIAPEQMTPKANMKVYMSVDKTYAYEGDKVGYTVQYRNYGSVNALDVTIQTPLDEDYTFVSATKGGVYDPVTHTITWNIGTVPGFKSGGLAATIDSVAFTVRITSLDNERVCETSTITGSNFPEWISNEYPNHATYTMERNCVDVLANRNLVVKKSANRVEMNPNDKVTFTVDFENVSSEDSWLNGGRDNVRISYANYYMNGNAYQFYHLYRFWNDSYEAYINMSNYRLSYYLYDTKTEGLYDAATNPTGWTFVVDNQNDLNKYGYNPSSGPITFSYQKLPQGEDMNGKWNQRLMIRFADELMAPSTHIFDNQDALYKIHKGVWGPGFIRARLAANPASDLTARLQDDWSFSTDISAGTIDGQGETFTLISPCWANYEDLGYEIDNYSRHVCSPTNVDIFDRVLVEEFDGYTWRRIQGRGPCSGKDAYNVVIVDTIPKTLRFDGFVTQKALGVDATYIEAPEEASYSGIVKWTYSELLAGEKGTLVYSCIANDIDCQNVANVHYISGAWIYSDTDSPDSSAVSLTTTCTELPPYLEPQSSLIITASQENAAVGDVISYEVRYENTTGTIVDEDCSSTTNWMGLGGKSVPSSYGGALPLSTSGSNAYFFGPKYSYGKDGAVYLTFSDCSSTTQELYFVMRYKSGTPGSGDFKGIAMKLCINIDGQHNFGYELYDNGTMVVREGTSWADAIQFSGSSSNPVFKFVLNGNHLYMYVNDQENEWKSVLKDWGNLSAAGPGNFGLYVNSNGNGSTAIDNFRSELDYAYDITLSGELPNELGDIKNITGSGTYNSGTKKITWPMVAGPIAPNDGFSYTFDATVEECNSYINNYAVASVYGQDSIRTVNSVKCVTTVLYGVVLNTNGGTINSGNVTEYTYGVGATLPTDVTMDGYTFEGWYEDEACETEPVLMISDEDSGNKTYYAKWSAQAAHVHSYEMGEWVWSSDNKSATLIFVCSQNSEHMEIVSATVSIDTVEATCKQEGSITYTATVIFEENQYTDSKDITLEKLNHTADTIMPIAPTCTKEGWTGGNVCSVCGDTLVRPEMVPATGHTADTIMPIAPTCTTDGWTGGNICSICGDTLVRPEMVPATGHTADTIYAIAPTCTKDGWTGGNVCSVCGDTLVRPEMVPATGHTADTIMPIAPTCMTDGWTGGNICSVCGDTLVRPEMVPANDYHTLQYIAAVAPTKFAEGNTEYWQCTECGKLFDSESAEHEITMADVVLEKLTDGTEYDRCDVEVSAVIQNCSCFGVADGAIELEIDNVDDFYVSWSNGRSGASAQELSAGMYYVSIIGNDDCQLDTSFVVTEPEEILVTETITQPSCNNSDGKIVVSTNATNPRYVWSDITFRNTLENASVGEYELTITSGNGCSVMKKYTLSNPGAPVIEIDTVLPARSRVHDGGIAINVTGGNGAFTYSWDNGSTTKNIGNLQAGDYTVQVTDENNCVAVQTITVPPVGFTNPEISLVTVDRLTQHNLVVWEREETDEIHHYNVYRESSHAFQYEKIGEVPYNDISVFEDEQADVKHQSSRYRITAVDYDGNESAMSKEHKTMLLAQNAGLSLKTVNLIWDSYEGIDYTMFKIYRNTYSKGWTLIDSISSRSFIWIDDNVPDDIIGYNVAIELPREINPKNKWQKAESGPFVIALSNIAEVENGTATDDIVSNNVKIYSFAKQIIIENAENQLVKVCDNTGRELYWKNASQVCGQQLHVDIKTSGLYFVMVGIQAFTVIVE